MSNLPALPDSAPAHLQKYANPTLAAANAALLGGISVGMHPMITTSGTRFVKKEGGNEEIIAVNGAPISVLGCVVLSAKPNLDKKYYATAYDPNKASEPDCQSSDGIKPDSGCPSPQHTTCAGCWANAFGSATGQNGQVGKGKACSDSKKLAIFAAGKVFGFAVPPASLKNWQVYVRDLLTRGIDPQFVITNIGFDVETPQILTFKFAGMLAEEKIPTVLQLVESKEVTEIVTFKLDNAPAALPAPAQAAPAQPAQVAPAQPAPAPAAAAPAPTRAPRTPKAAPPAQPAPAAPQPAPAPATAADPLGLGGSDPAPETAGTAVLSDSQIDNLLGI